MDTNLLESTLKNVLVDDTLEVCTFDVFNDKVTKYALVSGKFTISSEDTLTNYLESIKTKIDSSYIPGFMNLVSIPKIKEQQKNGNDKVSFKFQALSRKWYKMTSCIINDGQNEIIFSVRQKLEDETKTKESNDSKYNGLVARLADSILKIDNVFNLDEAKTNIKSVEEYINSVLNSLTSSYPELKRSLNKNAANVSGRVDDCILIVDDDKLMRNMIKKIFADEYKIIMAENGKEAIEYLEANSNKGITESSDNILGIFLDLTMPVMDGFAVLEYLSKNNYLYRIPVIIISGDYEKETKARVYNYGVADMLEKPFDFEVVKHRIENFINLYKSSNSLNDLISDQARDLKNIINPFVESYRYDYKENIIALKKYMKVLSSQVKEDYPEFGLDDEMTDKMSDAIEYYDIGFYSVPRSILAKKDGFTKEELDKIKSYPLFGTKMLDYVLSLKSDALYKKYASGITRYYHENYNGTGYPEKLDGSKIPVEAKIASVCINYYNLKKKYGNKAKDLIQSKSGVMFDPKIVNSFVKVMNNLD